MDKMNGVLLIIALACSYSSNEMRTMLEIDLNTVRK